jgi:hypothetical protein
MLVGVEGRDLEVRMGGGGGIVAACEVTGAGSYVPPIGGKRIERKNRKQSVPHMMEVVVGGERFGVGCWRTLAMGR